jgi:alcohol dehydrogenase
MDGLELNPRELSGTAKWSVSAESGRVVFGEGMIDTLGQEVRALGCRRALLVTDRGIRSAGHVERAEQALDGNGVVWHVFDEVRENPTTRHVEIGRRAAEGFGPDCIVALGGGSAMDCAKGINFVLTNGAPMERYRGTGKASSPMLASVGIPTTAGTGSEAQSYALISHETTHEKMACGDPKARFRTVILDPVLTASVPRDVRCVTAMDALSHAVESYVSTRSNPLSRIFARESWRLLASSLERALDDPGDAATQGRMLLGAHFAGRSIEHSMLGAAHACANPLTARFGITHGVAVALLLPHVVRFNRSAVGTLYEELERAADSRGRTERLDRQLERLRDTCGLPAKLSECGVPREALDGLAEAAVGQWTAGFNPRAVSRPQLRAIYESAY